MKRSFLLGLAAVVAAAGFMSAEEDTRSLAERAAEAASRTPRRKPTSNDKVLTNEDLKKAKGNVIFLTATPTPAAPAVVVSPPSGRDLASFGAIGEQREGAARLRGSIEEGQRQLAEATPEQRVAIEQRLKNALDDLARAHEAIGALSERARQGGTVVSPSE